MHDTDMKLEDYMRKKNMTDADFAILVGRHPSQICRYRNGATLPSWRTAIRIQEVTTGKVTVQDFFDERARRTK